MPLLKGLSSKLHFKMTMMSMDETSDLMSQADRGPELVHGIVSGRCIFSKLTPPPHKGFFLKECERICV